MQLFVLCLNKFSRHPNAADPKEIVVSEARVEDRVRSLTPAEVPELIAKAAAEDIQAQCLLGVAYANGANVPHDDAEAVRWPTRAASHGVAWVQKQAGHYVSPGYGCSTKLSRSG